MPVNDTILKILAISICFLCSFSSFASGDGETRISGLATDASSNAPIDFADVLLTDLDDHVLTSGNVNAGTFSIISAYRGEAILTIYLLGYEPYVSGKLDLSGKAIDLGTIALSPSSDGIQEVTVTGEKNMIVYRLDRQRINGQATLAASGGTAVDVLAGTPSVQTDSEGNVTLRGSSNFLVYVDGRLSPLEGAAALQQIPAASIEDIELITTPSARYRTDGDAGIINIITRKDKSAGWSGMLNLSAGTLGTWNVDGDLTYTRGRNSWYVGGTFQDICNRSDFDQEKTTTVDGIKTISTADGERWRKYGTYTGRAGWQFVDGRKHNLSIDILLGQTTNWRGGDMSYIQEMLIPDGSATRTDFDSHDRYKLAKTLYQYSLAHIWRPSDKHEISATSRLRYDSYSIEYTESNMFDLSGSRWEGTRGYEEEHHWDADGALTWKWNMADAFKLETGYQYTTYSEHGGYRIKYWNREAQDFEWQDDLATPFYYRRQVHSLYTMATGTAGRFSYDAGLRADRVIDQMDIEIVDASRHIRRFDLFPSAHAAYDAGAGTFSAGLSYRTNRPGIWNLEPYITYEDYFTKKIGNPDIDPEYITSAEFGWRKTFSPKLNLSATVYFRDRKDIADWVRSPYEPGVTLDQIVNAGNQKETGIEALAGFKPAEWWSSNLGGSAFFYDFTATDPSCTDRSGLFWKADWSNAFTAGKNTHVQLDAHAIGPRIITQGREEGYFYCDLAARHSFLKGSLTLSAVAHDVFHTAKYFNIRETDGLTSMTRVRPKYPNFIISLSYRFNASNKKAAGVSSDSLFEGKEF